MNLSPIEASNLYVVFLYLGWCDSYSGLCFFYPPSICDYVIHERPLLLEVFVFGKVYFVFVTVYCNTLVHTMDKPNPPTRMICFVYDFRFGAFLYLGCFVFVLVFIVIGIARFVFVMANFVFVMVN